MAFPTEFNSQAVVVGQTNIKHPIYKFKVNLDIRVEEGVGPSTNLRTGTVLHPDAYQSSPDLGRTHRVTRALQNTSWFATLLQAGNLEVNDDATITIYGIEGKKVLDTYTTGDYPLLTLINSAPYTSA